MNENENASSDRELQELMIRIVSAVRTIQNPSAENVERRNAQAYIDGWKEEHYHTRLRGVILETAIELLRQYSDDEYVQHFGLSTLAEYVREEWDNLTDGERKNMQSTAVKVLDAYIGMVTQGRKRHFIFEKLAEFVVSIAKRSWPQGWPDMLDILLDLVPDSATEDGRRYFVSVDLLAHILDVLSEEISTYNQDLPKQRRSELHSSLNLSLSSHILPFFVQGFDWLYNVWEQNELKERREEAKEVLSTFLRALATYLDWIGYDLVFTNKFIDALCMLLLAGLRDGNSRRVGAQALNCLLVLFSRKPLPDDVEEMTLAIFKFVEAISDIGIQALVFSGESAAPDEAYGILKKISQCLCQLGSGWIHRESANPHSIRLDGDGKAKNGTMPSSQDILKLYLGTIFEISKHPSVIVVSFSLPVILHILRGRSLSAIRNILLDSHFGEICEILIRLMRKPEKLRSIFDSQDFVSDKEFTQFVAQLKSSSVAVWKHVCAQQTDRAGLFLVEAFESLFANEAACARDPSALDEWTSNYESVGAMLDIYLGAVARETYHPKIVEIFRYVLGEVGPGVHSTILLQHLFLLSSIRYVLLLSEDLVPVLLEKIFDVAFSYVAPSQVGTTYLGDLSPDSVVVRRKASNCLLRTVTHGGWRGDVVRLFVPYVVSMANWFQESFGSLLHSDRVQLIETIIAVSNKMEDHKAQSQLIASLLESVVESWGSPDVAAALEDCRSFMEFIGTNEAPGTDFQKRRKAILVPIQIFSAVLKRFDFEDELNQRILSSPDHPFGNFISAIFGILFRLLRILHELPTFDIVSHIRSSILALSTHEIALLAGEEYPPEGTDLGSFLFVLRAAAYELLGHFVRLPMIFEGGASSSLISYLNDSAFFLVHAMTISNLRQFVHHFLYPFVVNIYRHAALGKNPSCMQFLFYGVSLVLQTAYSRISDEIERKEQIEEELQRTTGTQPQEEAIEDRLLSKLVRDVFSFLTRLARYRSEFHFSKQGNKPYKHTKKLKEDDFSEEFLTLLFSDACGRIILSILQDGLWWPLGDPFGRAIQVCNKLLASPALAKVQYERGSGGGLGGDIIMHGVRAMLMISNRSKKFNDERFYEEMSELSTLISQAASKLANGNSDMLLDVLSEFPNTTLNDRRELVRTLHSHPYEKESQKALQLFLRNSLALSFSKKKATILDIPQKLFLEKICRNQDPVLAIADGTIKDLFSPSNTASPGTSQVGSPK